jgi:hypothetical protein
MTEIPSPIYRLGSRNPIIQRIIDMYAHGEIITKEEALCQMIVSLATIESSMMDELVKYHMTYAGQPNV